MAAAENSSQKIVKPLEKPRWQRIGPVAALLFLSPFISEVLYGATRLSVIFVLIPEILTWGCGTLLIRECVRRWNKGWQSLLLMGLALAVAEELVIQQTSIAPLVGLAQHAYGRVWGVNWVYLLWALGYESVWVVLVPVQLVELLYPGRRNELWLRARGLVISGIIFVLGACVAWYGWTQRARILIFHMPPYSPPPLYLLAGVGVILLLVLSAYVLPSDRAREADVGPHSAPGPWTVGLVLCALGAPWSAFVLVGFGAFPSVPFELALGAGVAWAVLTLFLVHRWSSAANWSDAHRFASVFGGILACMLGGFIVFKVGGALRIDWIGKIILNAGAVAWLLSVRRKAGQPLT